MFALMPNATFTKTYHANFFSYSFCQLKASFDPNILRASWPWKATDKEFAYHIFSA